MSDITQAIQSIHEHWQPLQGDPLADQLLQSSVAFQAYLAFYHLQAFDAQAQHGFGYLPVDGQKIACHYWLPKSPAGCLVVLHGYYDHVGLYRHAVELGLSNNLAVIAFDLPGHGLSEGPRACIDDFGKYTNALAAVITLAKKLSIPGPLCALAQSTGCAVLLKYQLDLQGQGHADNAFDAQVLLAPLVRPHGWRYSRVLHFFLQPFVRNVRRIFSVNSHDEDFLAFILADPLQPRHLSVRWVSAMKQWLLQLWKSKSLPVPTLIVQGKEDFTVDWRFNIPVLAARLPDHQIHWIPEGRHQLINESVDIRADYFPAVRRFIQCALRNLEHQPTNSDVTPITLPPTGLRHG